MADLTDPVRRSWSSPRWIRRGALLAALAASLALPGLARAGELKFGEGEQSLATDDTGKLTAAGAKTALTELDKIPGQDAWDLKVWARIDRGSEGPLYVEFYREGEKEPFWRYEDRGYEGGKYWSQSILLEGRHQFNKNQTYVVRLVQVGDKDKDIRLAEAKLKLINTGREPPPSEEDEEDDEDEEDEEDDRPARGGAEAPPPVADPAKKKGCAIAGPLEGSALGLGLLLVGGLGRRRVRR